MTYWSVDGMAWDIPCDIDRVANIEYSSVSGMLLNKDYLGDPWGTWLQYDVSIVVPTGRESDYASIYEILINPIADHEFVLPYNQGMIYFTGRIQNVSDSLYIEKGTLDKIWRRTKFTVIGNAPHKKVELDGTITTNGAVTPDDPFSGG